MPLPTCCLGYIGDYSQGSNQVKFYNRYKIVEPYFQDDWRVTPRLTLNLGLRLSLFGTYREKYRHAYNWDPAVYEANAANAALLDTNGDGFLSNAGDPSLLTSPMYTGLVQCGVTPGVPVGCSKGHLFNPAPRIGFAFDPWGDGKTAIRGGYGIFFEHTNGNEANTESLETQSSPLIQMGDQYNIPSYGAIGGSGSMSPLSFVSIPDKTIWPYVQQWHLDLERDLSHNTVLTVSYVGSKGTHLTRQGDINQLQPVPSGRNPYKVGEAIGDDDCETGLTPSGVAIPGYVYNPRNPEGNPLAQSGVGRNMFVACGGDADYFRPYSGATSITRIESAASSSYQRLGGFGPQNHGRAYPRCRLHLQSLH